MSARGKKYQFYGPAHFRATWAKFLVLCERDGQSASELLRIWVEGYVSRKDPGNPQRPLTAWVPGHQDEVAVEVSGIISKLEKEASRRGNELSLRRVLEELKPVISDQERPQVAEIIASELYTRGIKVWR